MGFMDESTANQNAGSAETFTITVTGDAPAPSAGHAPADPGVRPYEDRGMLR